MEKPDYRYVNRDPQVDVSEICPQRFEPMDRQEAQEIIKHLVGMNKYSVMGIAIGWVFSNIFSHDIVKKPDWKCYPIFNLTSVHGGGKPDTTDDMPIRGTHER